MKTAEAKPAAKQTSKSLNPFFNKGGNALLSSEIDQEPFFSPRKDSFFKSHNGSVQTKLTIGQPNDKYEQEADATAERVVQRLSENKPAIKNGNIVQTKPVTPATIPGISLVQAKCAGCEQEEKLQKEEPGEEDQLQKKAIFESDVPPDDDTVQRTCAKCSAKEQMLQTKTEASSTAGSPNLESRLHSAKGDGSPMPSSLKDQMESSFGADFSNVRLHTDNTAAEMNKDLHAQAFTHGSDIYFNAGKYDTSSSSGKHLLAHELTHTVQQGAVGPQPQLKAETIQRKKTGEEVQDRLRVENTKVTTEAPIPGAAPTGIPPGVDFDRLGFADLYEGATIPGIRGIAIDEIKDGADAGKKKYVYANVLAKDLAKAQGPNTSAPSLAGASGDYARFIVDPSSGISKHFSGHNSVTGNFPDTAKIGEIKGKGSLLDNPLLAPKQLADYKSGISKFIASAKRDLGAQIKKPGFSALSGLTIPEGLRYDDFNNQQGKTNKGFLLEGSNRIWLAEVGTDTGIYLWARLPHPFNIPADVAKEEHEAIAKLRQDVLAKFNEIKQKKPQGSLGKKEMPGKQEEKPAPAPNVAKRSQPEKTGRPVNYHPNGSEVIQRNTDWKAARENFNKSLSEWKKKYGKKFLKNDQVEKYLEEKVEYDKALKKKGVTTGKIGEATKDYQRIEYWAGAKGYLFGNLRFLLGEKFDWVADKIEGLRERTKRAKLKAAGLTSPKFSKGWMAKIVSLLLVGFKAMLEKFLEISFQVFASCISAIIEKYAEEMRQKLMDGLIDEELEKQIEELQKEVEEFLKVINEKYEEEIAAIEALIELMRDAAFYTQIITTAVNLIRLGVQVVSCLTPPLLGCLWGLVVNVGIEVALNLVVGTEWFKKEFMDPLVKNLMDGFLKKSLLEFLNKVFKLVGLADYVVGIAACTPSTDPVKGFKVDTGEGVLIPPDMYRAHAQKWEAENYDTLMKDVVDASGGTATRADVERFLKTAKDENMTTEKFNEVVTGSKTGDQGFDFGKIAAKVPGAKAPEGEGGTEVKVIDGEKSPLKGELVGGKAGTIQVYDASLNHTKGMDTTITLICTSINGEMVMVTNVQVKVMARYYWSEEKGVRLAGREGAGSMQIIYRVTRPEGYSVNFSDVSGAIPLGKELRGYAKF